MPLPRMWCAGLLAASILVVCAAPRAYEAEYTAVRGGLRAGRMLQSLALDGQGGYRMDLRLEPTGIATMFTDKTLSERSEGTMVRGLPQPERFEHRPQGGPKAAKDFRNFHFDRKAGRITDLGGSGANISLAPAIRATVQDDLSQMEVLRQNLAQGKGSFELPVLYAGKDAIYTYRYTVIGKETVEDAGGKRHATVHVSRTDSRGKYRYELWCAAALGYIPVRIERYRNERHEAGLLLVRYAGEQRATSAPQPPAPGGRPAPPVRAKP